MKRDDARNEMRASSIAIAIFSISFVRPIRAELVAETLVVTMPALRARLFGVQGGRRDLSPVKVQSRIELMSGATRRTA